MTPYAPPPFRRTPSRVAPYRLRTIGELYADALDVVTRTDPAPVLDRLAALLGPDRLRREAEAAAKRAEGGK